MELTQPHKREDYIGETINGYSYVTNKPTSFFVEPRPNVFTQPFTTTAIILGNGITRNYPEVQLLINLNYKRSVEGYKLVYACNQAIHDELTYDYYVVKQNVFLARANEERATQTYVPYDIFVENKDKCNLLPYVSHMDSGASAAYLACFDGHKKIFLFGFDGDCGAGYQTMYDQIYPYTENSKTIDYNCWKDYLTTVMTVYSDVSFYRVQIDGQESPIEWRSLSNFKDVTVRQAVLLGDF